MWTRHLLSTFALSILALLTPVSGRATEHCSDDIAAVKFLGKADCFWYPEAQTVLIDTLKNDPREKVRYAAVMALTEQLQRGKAPLDATSGWRQVPDPEIFTQICRLATLQHPLTKAELYQCYKARQENYINQQSQNQGDYCRDCCTTAALEALARTAFERDLFYCWVEPSERIRWRAERALTLCCGQGTMEGYMQQYTAPVTPNSDPNAPVVPPMIGNNPAAPDNTATATQLAPFDQGFQGNYAGEVPILGRADYSNRFNIFDNMSAAPRSRVWYGYQFVDAQNNAVFQTADTTKLFEILNTSAGRAQFISLTGFGRQPGEPAINPLDPNSKAELQKQFLVYNGGRSQKYLATPDSSLHRFGAEWAVTTDFSISLNGQYVMPLADNEQPNSFSNPAIQLKHVLYRDEDLLLSGILNIQAQISRPKFGVGEDTSRIGPGLLAYKKLSEKIFSQSAAGFSFPTESHQITTFDYAIGVGAWAYKHESLEPYFRGPKPDNFILAFIPQFEVLGKTVLGNNALTGTFDTINRTAMTAPGTVSPIDGTRNIYFAQDFRRFQQTAFIYRETRNNVDLTLGASTIFRNNFVFSTAVSAPVTGGNARALEFISSLNKYF